MHVSLAHGDISTDLVVDGLSPSTTVAELLHAFGLPGTDPVFVDHRPVPAETAAGSCLYEGALISVGDAPGRAEAVAIELHAAHGPVAGHVWRLAVGRYDIGAGSAAIAWPGAPPMMLEASPEGANIDGVQVASGEDVRIGDAWFRVRRPIADNPTAYGALTFNRPPRTLEADPVTNLDLPSRKKVQGTPRRLSVVAMVLPALFGIVMAVVFHRLMFLAFALMGPLMMVGNTIDDRRRRRRETAENEVVFTAQLGEFRTDLAALVDRCRRRAVLAAPCPAELLSRVDAGDPRVWERRTHHPDFMTTPIGVGDTPCAIDAGAHGSQEPEVVDAIATDAVMRSAPITVDMRAGMVVGFHGGPRELAAAAARAMLAAIATHHGPADVRIAILTDSLARWDWAKWLPHVHANDGEIRLLAATPQQMGSVLGFLRTRPDGGASVPLTVVISDMEAVENDLRRLHREVVAGAGMPVAALVIRDEHATLPGSCTELIDLSDGVGRRSRPGLGTPAQPFVPWTMTDTAAHTLARRLARFDDPEAVGTASSLPDHVSLMSMLGMTTASAADIAQRWTEVDHRSLSAPIGGGQGGNLTVDLVADGPHGLVAGTTGSGKSELLRSLVASLAATYSPAHLNFVLIDYKGGSAFDACARLPHVVGLVTDLDEHLGARALTCLEAELRYREEQLRDVGASDINEYGTIENAGPLPRMVLIVDEFAAMASELPDFMNALVDIAQRGRSLGVHMILATQRPSGVVKDSIRANTNLRISLRVQTPADSKDVLSDAIAARIPRSRPGRAFLRLGPGELVPFQSAISTLPHRAQQAARLRLAPFVYSMQDQPLPVPSPELGAGPSDLALVVDAAIKAYEEAALPPPRRPWPEPLPESLSVAELPAPAIDSIQIPVGVRDEPDRQIQRPHLWEPNLDGNLLIAGPAGPTDVLRTIAHGLAAHHPDEVHAYAIDHGTGGLSAAGALPHVGAVIAGSDRERQQRLLRMLQEEIGHRKASRAAPTTMFLLLDGLSGFRATFDDMADLELRESLNRIVADGPAVGVFTVVTIDQARSVPGAMLGLFRTRLVFQVADRMDYTTLGVTARNLPDMGRGRCIDVTSGRFVQAATTCDEALRTVAASHCTERSARPIETLAETVKLADLMHVASVTDTVLTLPAGVGNADLRPATLRLEAGDHAVVTGAPRSGKSNFLAATAAAAHHIDPDRLIVAICPRSSALRDEPAVTHLYADLTEIGELLETNAQRPILVLIDDADEVDDPADLLETFMRSRAPGRHLIAAARSDALKGSFRHWTKALRSARRGLVLRPFDAGDGEPLGARLPRTVPTGLPPGRGYLCDAGAVTLVQTPLP